MHMWHHVTNHLIISNDKDFNSENRIKLRVRDNDHYGLETVLQSIVIVPGNPQVFWEPPIPILSKTHTWHQGSGFHGFGCRFGWVTQV
jgi:hypothetical protein